MMDLRLKENGNKLFKKINLTHKNEEIVQIYKNKRGKI